MRVNRCDYTLFAGRLVTDTAARAIALSPDGRRFVYYADYGLYLRAINDRAWPKPPVKDRENVAKS